jgi:hypothetical protein
MALAGEDMRMRVRPLAVEEACMLTPAPAARSFSEFLEGQPPATTDASLHSQPAPWTEASDNLSYFDAIMRLRGRRPIRHCRRHSPN